MWSIVGALALLALALASRLPFFHGNSFPLNDGGMFAQIVDELRANHFLLPRESAYNFEHIPLCYPPLGFYFGAIAGALFHQSTVQVLRWLPLFFNLLSIPVVYGIAFELLELPVFAFTATAIYIVNPKTSLWLTMGGGLTRAPGELFALIAIFLFARALRRRSIRLAVAAGVATGLAALTHLEALAFAAVSLTVLALFTGRLRYHVRLWIVAGVVGVAVAAPWALWTVHREGVAPFAAAFLTRGSAGTEHLGLNAEVLAPWLALAVLLWLLKKPPFGIWIVALMLFVSRSAPTHTSLPEALLAAWLLLLACSYFARPVFAEYRLATAGAILCFVLCCGWIVHYLHVHYRPGDRLNNLIQNERATLLPEDLAVMNWTKANTAVSARFLVYDQRTDFWPADFVAEWFPYFARRQSVMTAQGREWLPGRAFGKTLESIPVSYGTYTPEDVANKLAGRDFDYILISGPFDKDHQHIVDALRHWPGFTRVVYQTGNTEVLARY